MRAFVIPPAPKGVDDLRLVERPEPTPRAGQVVVRIRAASLNYRDQAVITGTYPGPTVATDLIPLSDGAGEVTAVGDGVTRVRVGDRVAATFGQTPPRGGPFGPQAPLGSPLDGMLADAIALYEDGLVVVPAGLSFEEAACLPCAAVTAWNALMATGKPIIAGQTVLALGTGGVSTFALQFARAAGARVLVTSSSDEKIARMKALGASDGINYTRTPDWDKEALRLTDGRGVDCVIETGGAGTLGRSFQAVAAGGKVCLIGVLTGRDGANNPYVLMRKRSNLHGIWVGDREMFEQMNRAIEVNDIRPLVDRVFGFEDAPAAFRLHISGGFIGKVVIKM